MGYLSVSTICARKYVCEPINLSGRKSFSSGAVSVSAMVLSLVTVVSTSYASIVTAPVTLRAAVSICIARKAPSTLVTACDVVSDARGAKARRNGIESENGAGVERIAARGDQQTELRPHAGGGRDRRVNRRRVQRDVLDCSAQIGTENRTACLVLEFFGARCEQRRRSLSRCADYHS